MFSTARTIWLAASWRKAASASEYWSGDVLATARTPTLRPWATSGTSTYERTPSWKARSSIPYRRSWLRSRQSRYCWCWNVQPTWLSPGGISMPTVKYDVGRDDSRMKRRSTSLSRSGRKIAVRSKATARRSARAIAWKRSSRVERAAAEPSHGSRKLTAELLALHDPPPQRQARVDAGIGVHVRRRQTPSEAPADRAQLVEQHRLGDALELDAHGLADLDEIVDAIEGRAGHEDLAADRAPLDSRGEVHGGADHGVLRPLLGADVADDRLTGVD